jgi:hypothetical protein
MQVSMAARLRVPDGHAGSMPVAQVRFLAARALRVEHCVARDSIRQHAYTIGAGLPTNYTKHFPEAIRAVGGSRGT